MWRAKSQLLFYDPLMAFEFEKIPVSLPVRLSILPPSAPVEEGKEQKQKQKQKQNAKAKAKEQEESPPTPSIS